MDLHDEEGPFLVDCPRRGQETARQTLIYKNRPLYSKYDPERAVLSLIQKNTPVDPASLILVFSPCLCYGLSELFAAADRRGDSAVDTGESTATLDADIPDAKAAVVAVEADEKLYAVAKERLAAVDTEGRTELFSAHELAALDARLRALASTGRYRRVLRLDFSAGTVFAPDFYGQVAAAAQEIIASFWKNQVTLLRMGRLFAKNIFQNLPLLSQSPQLNQFAGSVSCPILVCGAGESLDTTQVPGRGCFVIAVDAALPALLPRGIRPDAVVSLESQAVIQKAYIGAASAVAGSPPLLFADITSRPSVPRSFPNRTVFFASKYAEASYLDRLAVRGIIHDYTAPLGSVGLAAVSIALRLRKDEGIPVFVTGMDFSYSAGRTHASGVPHAIQRLSTSCRISPAENYGAAFGPASLPVESKDGSQMISIKSMTGYAESFRSTFTGQKTLLDIGRTGLDLGLPRAENAVLLETADRAATNKATESYRVDKETDMGQEAAEGKKEAACPAGAFPKTDLAAAPQEKEVASFLAEEKTALLTLKDLLMHGDESQHRDKTVSLNEQLSALLAGREYLYLHFPDGYRVSTDTAFLKRVRAETDFFLKQIAFAEGLLPAARQQQVAAGRI
ncbi:MAG: DUF115 domain-containing protein [Treponema sp.]|nr:DUF115 domain-containing protein [Treponema sp.]